MRCVFPGVSVISILCLSALAKESAQAPREEAIAEAAQSLRTKLIETRRDFHMHPELSSREERTSRIVAERLREFGLEVKTNIAKHGVIAVLKGGKPGPVVAVRADMDALPINETMNVPYKSLVAGVKHACGHDVHTTVELGVAEVLSKMRDRLPGSVKFLFQPAEEGPPKGEEGGAKLMIKEGALDHPRPLAIFGMHCTPELEVGKIGFRAGPAQAAADEIDLTIHGKMGHAAFPHRGVDAIVVASECVLALQNIRSRRTDVNDPFILTLGTIQGGTRRSVIADEVKMQGTFRAATPEMRERVQELSRQTLGGICAAYDATFDLEFTEISTFVHNDSTLVAETLPAIRRAIGETNVVEVPVRMGSEDFSYFQKIIPGFYFRLGTGNKAKGITADIHTPDFDVDEECLPVGIKTMANVLVDFLERHAAKAN